MLPNVALQLIELSLKKLLTYLHTYKPCQLCPKDQVEENAEPRLGDPGLPEKWPVEWICCCLQWQEYN